MLLEPFALLDDTSNARQGLDCFAPRWQPVVVTACFASIEAWPAIV